MGRELENLFEWDCEGKYMVEEKGEGWEENIILENEKVKSLSRA